MSKVKFVLNFKGVHQLLRCDEMKKVLESYAEDVSRDFSQVKGLSRYYGKSRLNVSVVGKKKRGLLR